MRQLTTTQAALFRKLRPVVPELADRLQRVSDDLADACACEDDPECPVCVLFAVVSLAAVELEAAAEQLDGALLTGPGVRETE